MNYNLKPPKLLASFYSFKGAPNPDRSLKEKSRTKVKIAPVLFWRSSTPGI
jgi:hypothetical protein